LLRRVPARLHPAAVPARAPGRPAPGGTGPRGISLHRPGSLEEACALLAGSEGRAMVYGGGTAVQILIKEGVLGVRDLVDLARIPGLGDLVVDEDGIHAGTMVSIRDMETDPRAARAAPLVADCYGHVSNPRVRNTASVGGNLAHGDYRLDPPAALLVLDAEAEVVSVRGTRRIPVRRFFVDFEETALENDEIIVAIHIPAQPPASGAAYVKLSSLRADDWPAASAAALVTNGDGARSLRLGVGALAPVPLFQEVDVSGRDLEEAIALAKEEIGPRFDPIPDIRGSAGFKSRLGLVAVEDAVRRAWVDDAGGR
ncbi:MAG: FAD binding domain-containing protein, partial [Actinomycetota bacterium]